MLDNNGKVVNNLNADDAVSIKNRITNIMKDRVYYGNVYSYADPKLYSEVVGNLEDFTSSEVPENADIENGYTAPIPDSVRIKQAQGAKIIHPLLAICDKGDLTFVVTNELIPNSFDKDEIEAFLATLEEENKDIYASDSSCRSACTGLCVGTCGNTCDGCSSNCDNVCTGCGSCTGNCSQHCGTSCQNSCLGTCDTGCGGGCSGCFGQCEGGCFADCYAACGGGCTEGCTGSCKGGEGGTASCTNCSVLSFFLLHSCAAYSPALSAG